MPENESVGIGIGETDEKCRLLHEQAGKGKAGRGNGTSGRTGGDIITIRAQEFDFSWHHPALRHQNR